ncbi:MAG: FHA domain-containing protein [Candidatus Xenobia bacterium]
MPPNPPLPALAGVLYFARLALLGVLWAVILYAVRYLMREVAPPRRAGVGASVLGRLIVQEAANGLQAGAIYPVDGELTFGRTDSCTVKIDDPFVSSVHARITSREGRHLVEDMGSRNGTCVRGERIGEATPLSDGDELRIGPALFVYHVGGSA